VLGSFVFFLATGAVLDQLNTPTNIICGFGWIFIVSFRIDIKKEQDRRCAISRFHWIKEANLQDHKSWIFVRSFGDQDMISSCFGGFYGVSNSTVMCDWPQRKQNIVTFELCINLCGYWCRFVNLRRYWHRFRIGVKSAFVCTPDVNFLRACSHAFLFLKDLSRACSMMSTSYGIVWYDMVWYGTITGVFAYELQDVTFSIELLRALQDVNFLTALFCELLRKSDGCMCSLLLEHNI
jgi:hypothetical protein